MPISTEMNGGSFPYTIRHRHRHRSKNQSKKEDIIRRGLAINLSRREEKKLQSRK